MSEAEVHRKNIKDLEWELERERGLLKRAEASCQHSWGPTQADHVYHEAYTIPGDAPGTCGVDWRGPCYVPSRTDKRWKRRCSKCGKVEHTTQTTVETSERPVF